MKNTRNIFLLGGFLTLVAVLGSVFLLQNSEGDDSATELDPQNKWIEFRNTAFHYSLTYPSHPYPGPGNVTVGSGNDYSGEDYTDEGSVYFSGQKTTFFNIAIYDSLSPDIILDLRSFVEKKRQINIDNKKKRNISNKTIGELEKITVDNREGYGFLMNHSFETETGGSLIPPGETYLYIFLEHNGNKIVLSYPYDNPVSQKILSSFKFE